MSEEATPSVPRFNAPKKTVSLNPPIILIHSVPGCGKTTLASSAPDALFLFTENGQRDLEVQTITDAPFETLGDFLAGLDYVGRGIAKKEITNVKTLVVDSLDHLETLVINGVTEIYRQRAKADGFPDDVVKAIVGFNEIPAKYNFEKWSEIDAQWQAVWKRIVRMRQLGIAIVGICHSHLRTVDDPASDSPFERHELKLDAKRAQKYWVDNADVIGFIRYPTVMDAETKRTSQAKVPYIEFERSAAWMSKPNFGLTRKKLDNKANGFMDTFAANIGFYKAQQKDAK